MKCCSRSTLGVIIGILNILIYIFVAVVMLGLLQNLQERFDKTVEQKEKAAELGTVLISSLFAACLAMIIVSGVLIMGIIKRRHKLILPWLVLHGLGLAVDGARVVLTLILSLVNGISLSVVLTSFVFGVIGVCLGALIFWTIYSLWRDIRRMNDEKSGKLIADVHYGFDPANAPPQYHFLPALPQKS
ncbi:hypothetical protein FF38_01592 [Lucilia cuprina]|uniref:Uncharacterized protein n=1 Tax=Lucilia cuprina TaxID=7375 RepID=A0A0L0CH92_LUCCU|nr:hypothetical protein CVS40_2996 [Lucilia cuprina]KNC30854.1 hypothetical protein FF38_01592 [Lucilia cuprina]